MPVQEAIVIAVDQDGTLRALYADGYDFVAHGTAPPSRASHVEPIPAGPCAGQWYVDLSPLGPQFAFCLWPPFRRRDAALEAEKQFVIEKWVKSGE